MEGGHLGRSRGMDPDLVDRANKAAANEARPSGRAEATGCQFGEDIVHELAAISRACDRVAIREPLAGLMAHAGTIAADASQSVMDVTFPAAVSRKMGIVAVVSSADRYDLVVIGGGSAGLTAEASPPGSEPGLSSPPRNWEATAPGPAVYPPRH